MAEERQSTEGEPAEVAEPLAEAPDSSDEDAPPLDPEAEARRVAAMSFIRRLGDPVLKSSATPVDRFDDSNDALIVPNDVLRIINRLNAVGAGLLRANHKPEGLRVQRRAMERLHRVGLAARGQ